MNRHQALREQLSALHVWEDPDGKVFIRTGPTTTRQCTVPEVNAADAVVAADVADENQAMIDKQTVKSAYTTAINRLQQIENAAAPSNAQVVQAVRDLAQFQRQLLQALRRTL